MGIQPVDAQTLLSHMTDSVPPVIDAEHVLHFRTVVYQRVNPVASEPKDPYHQPVRDFLSDTYEVEHWIRGGQLPQSRSTARDQRTGRIVYDHMQNGDTYGVYTVESGYASVQNHVSKETIREPALPYPEFAHSKGLKVSETPQSQWGRPAWIATGRGTPPSDSAADRRTTASHPLPFQKPYLADLSVQEFEHTWEVDQVSQRLVRYTWNVITPSGQVLVQSIKNTLPEVFPLSAAPRDWLAFPHEAVPVIEGASGSETTLHLPPISLEQAVAEANFAVYLPNTSAWKLTPTAVYFKPQAEAEAFWRQHWRFDIQNASAHGLALEAVFTPDPAQEGQAFVVIQGSGARLIPQMRESMPIWTESHPVSLAIGGSNVEGWVATGGVLDGASRQVVVMLELQNTFLFVVGQGYNEGEVLDIVRTLRPAK